MDTRILWNNKTSSLNQQNFLVQLLHKEKNRRSEMIGIKLAVKKNRKNLGFKNGMQNIIIKLLNKLANKVFEFQKNMLFLSRESEGDPVHVYRFLMVPLNKV